MSAKLGSTAPSPSIANLASKVISQLASNNINLGHNSIPHNNIINNNNNNNSSSNHINQNNNSSSNTHSVVDEDEGSNDNEEHDEDAGIIRCICNYTEDDGFTIQCERCFVWQHGVCVGVPNPDNVPDKYLCELCSPRPVDRKRANEIQRRRNGNVERRREKSPSRRKPSVGRPRKQLGPGGASLAEQGLASASSSSSSAPQHGSNPGAGGSSSSSNGHLSKNAAGVADSNGKRIKGTHSSGASNPSQPTSSSALPNSHPSTKQRSAGQSNSSRTPVTNEDDDLDMESDGQDDVLDAYQFEFSPVETNTVMSKAVQDLFRQVIAQFRQAQSRKRSLSLTSGVKLHELVASNPAGGVVSNSSTPSAADSPDAASTTLGSQPPQPTGPTLSTDASNVVSMERESLARPLMKTTVKHILPSSRLSHSPVPQYGLFAETNIGTGRFMMEFKGEVSLKSSYKTDPINQYAILATPKPFVLFHPQLNLVVDARRCGNDARFVRRSCVPNTEVKSIVVPGVQDQTVHLGLFAKVPIAKGEEITLDWDWNKEHSALQAIKPLSEKSKDGAARKSQKEVRKAKHLVASTLLAQTDCACENKETCLLHLMLRDGLSEPGARHPDPSPSAAKGSRPKKVAAESLRQRYGSQRERSEADDQDGKRFADQDTSDDEISVAESSPRRKSPKAPKPESVSKKARHESHPNQNRGRAEQYPTSDSDSDDNRKRKQKVSDRRTSPSKRSSSINQEMSAREMKQALMLIKKMEDKDAGLAGSSKQKTQELGANSSQQTQRRSGVTSPKARPRDKNKTVDINKRSASPQKAASAIEEDNISIGDSGIDSDSNNGLLRRDPAASERSATTGNKRLQAVQAQGKRDREQMEDGESLRSPATSDTERREGGGRFVKRPPLPSQSGKKQPYATASRERRMTEQSGHKQRSKDRIDRHAVDPMDESQNLSGSSSVESSFVSVVGNTSDEEDEAHHRMGRRLLREKNMPKETLPVASLKPSVLPCKKVWKMIYMKQRAVAEEEAREKAEEMRKKAEEVFDLKMEEDEPAINNNSTPSAAVANSAPDATLAEVDSMEASSAPSPRKESPALSEHQSSIIKGDVLNLFHEDVKPESHTASKGRHADEPTHAAGATVASAPVIQQPVVIKHANLHQPPTELAATSFSTDSSRTQQKMCLESYQARKLTSSSPAPPETHQAHTDRPFNSGAVVAESTTPTVSESMDLDPPEASVGISSGDEYSAKTEPPAAPDSSVELKHEVAPSVPKVKLSLQEYQKQRQEASQRTVSTPSLETPSETKTGALEDNEPKRVHGLGQDADSVSAQTSNHESVDVEMAEAPVDSAMVVVEQGPAARGDYFEVGASLPTPLIGLSSRAHAGAQPSGDYFPVQQFSPTSLSAGPTPFAKLNLASSPPPRTPVPSDAQPTGSPTKSPGIQRPPSSPSPKQPQGMSLEIKSPGSKLGTSPPQNQGPSGWRTPRSQRGTSPQSLGSSGAPAMNYRGAAGLPADTRLTSPRFYGSPSDRAERLPAPGPLASPTRERQHSMTSAQPSSPFDSSFPGGHYGYSEDMASFKRPGPLSSPTGPLTPTGSREYYKPDERSRHRSVNSDEWGYGNVDPVAYGGYRGPRGAPPPPPRDRDRDRDRDRERERDHERERERERRDRYDRRGDYFASGAPGGGSGSGGIPGNSPGFYGPNRGPGGPVGMGGGPGGGAFGRRPSDYYGSHAREGGYSASNNNNSSSSGAGGGFAGSNNGGKKEGALDSPSLSGSGSSFAGGQGGYLAENSTNASANSSSNSNSGRRM
ncbi:unnamed protein product [Mortierella alpina]